MRPPPERVPAVRGHSPSHRAWLLAALTAAALSVRWVHAQDPPPRPEPTPGPPPTPGPAVLPIFDTPILGPLPDCAGQAELTASNPVVRVNEPLTLTLRTRLSCPALLDARGVVLLLGGLPAHADLAGTRSALRGIVDAVAGGEGNRLALVDVASPQTTPGWAATRDGFDGIAAAVERVNGRSALTIDAWRSALSTVQRRLAEVDVQHRPFLIVVDGTGAATDADEVRATIARLGFETRDAAGHVVLVDLTTDGRLFFPLAERGAPDAPFVTVFAAVSPERTIDGVVGMALAAFHAPISQLQAHILIEGRVVPAFTCAPIETVPPAFQVSGANALWKRSVGAHTARFDAVMVLRIERPMGEQRVNGVLEIERDGAPSPRETFGVAAVSSTTICAAPPFPAALACPPRPDAAAFRLLPQRCSPRNALWLPYLFYAGAAAR